MAAAQRYDQQFSRLLQASELAPSVHRLQPVGFSGRACCLDLRVFTLDKMLDDIMLYWLTTFGPSSARLDWEAMREMMSDEMSFAPMPTPTGISMFPGEQVCISCRWAERRFSKRFHFKELDRRGHFAAMEQSELFGDEVRATFQSLR